MTISFDFLTFPFDDESWISKFVIGGFLSMLGAFGWILILPLALVVPVYGYMVRIMRQTIVGDDPTLPAWDDWGELFRDGLKVMAVYAVYFAPLLIMLCASYALLFVPILSATLSGSDPEAALPVMMVGYGTFFVAFACTFILILPLAFMSAAGLGRMVATDSVSAAFQFGEVWSLVRRGFRNYFMAFVLIFGVLSFAYVALLAATYSIILYCIVPFLTAFISIYFVVLMGAMFGKAYYETEGAPPAPTTHSTPDPQPDDEPDDSEPDDDDLPDDSDPDANDDPPDEPDSPPEMDATLLDQPPASKKKKDTKS